MLKDALTQVSALCVGAAAMAWGDASGGVVTATAAGGLAAVLIGRRAELREEHDRVFARVTEAHSARMAGAALSAREREAAAVIDALFAAEAENVLLDRAMLVGAAFADRDFAEHVAGVILARLGVAEPDHSGWACGYARALVRAGLAAAMESATFYRDLRLDLSLEEARRIGRIEAGQASMQAGLGSLHEKFDRLLDRVAARDAPERKLLRDLAEAFDHEHPDAPPEKVAEFLTEKAREFREMQARLEALAEADGRIANLVGAAEAALAAGDFDEADARLADAEEMQQAEHTLVQVRKQAKLREERGSAALLKGDAERAAAHFEAAAGFFEKFDAVEGARLRHAAADRLDEHGLRFGGGGLAAAIGLYRANLEVYTRDAHPVNWAGAQNNLGIALRNQGARAGGAEGARLLAEAAAAFRAAMEVWTRDAHPVHWAATQNNLGNALADQGARAGGAEGARLLAEAAAAYRAAMEVWTRDAHPVDWAATQKNVALAFEDLAECEHEKAAAHLAAALAAVERALEVFDPEHMPYDHGTATATRKRIAGKLAGLG